MSVLIKGLSQGDLKRGDVFVVKMFGSPCLCRVKGGIVSPYLDEGGIFWTEEVETRRGRWIIKEAQEWQGGAICACSKCRYGFAMGAYFEPDLWRFCPMCGAEMETEENIE